jgi:hypothetical protein
MLVHIELTPDSFGHIALDKRSALPAASLSKHNFPSETVLSVLQASVVSKFHDELTPYSFDISFWGSPWPFAVPESSLSEHHFPQNTFSQYSNACIDNTFFG